MKIWRFIAVPAAVFLVGLILFSRILNQGVGNPATDMSEATLPVVYMVHNGERINELHGYTDEMDALSMRDTITPLEDDGSLSISIDSYGGEIQEVSFEVRSLDMSRLVQSAEADILSDEEGVVTVDLPIQNLLTEQTEYLLTLEVTSSGTSSYFYTRIIEEHTSNLDECLSFVKQIHTITMNKNRQSELTDYMETTWGANNSNLYSVTLSNSTSQMCWGSLEGEEVTEPIVSIQSIDDICSEFVLHYILSSVDEEGVTEYYDVEEYYRVRKGEERMYLLNFERTAEQIFSGEHSEHPSQNLVLGIRSSDVEFQANEAGTDLCFVQAGELWHYNADADSLTQVFGFRTPDVIDMRENYGEHDIRIIRTNSTGSVNFVVYGYMNRGDHEGEVGISVCYFDSATSSVEEQVFLPSRESYQMLRAGIGQPMYISEYGLFYFVMEDQLYSVDLDTGESQLEIADMTEGNYAGSQNGRYLAWTSGEATEARTMYMIDLETGRTEEITAPDGYLIRALGFLDSDCIYGLVRERDVGTGATFFPMSSVYVVDFSSSDLAVLKTYEAVGNYVSEVEVQDGNIYLELVTYADGRYTDSGEDIIYNREMQDASAVLITTVYSDLKETEIALQIPKTIETAPELMEKKWLRSEDIRLDLLSEANERTYYVYAGGQIVLATDSLANAVESAEENTGVVIGEDQTYVWKAWRSGWRTIDYPFADGEEPAGPTYDLTGCTLQQVLYYVDTGVPVYGVMSGRQVVITGYDAASITMYDSRTGESTSLEIGEASEMFAVGGNVFTVTCGE